GAVAIVLVVAIVIAAIVRRPRVAVTHAATAPLVVVLCALLLGVGFRFGLQPASHVEFEDAHVIHSNEAGLHPPLYTVSRFAYRGGWILHEGDSLSFLAREGSWKLEAITGLGATIELGGNAYEIAPTKDYQTLRVTIPDERVTLRCL